MGEIQGNGPTMADYAYAEAREAKASARDATEALWLIRRAAEIAKANGDALDPDAVLAVLSMGDRVPLPASHEIYYRIREIFGLSGHNASIDVTSARLSPEQVAKAKAIRLAADILGAAGLTPKPNGTWPPRPTM